MHIENRDEIETFTFISEEVNAGNEGLTLVSCRGYEIFRKMEKV